MASGCKIGTRLQNYIGSPVADAAAIRALPADDIHHVDGAAFVKLDDSSLWVFDIASTATAGDVVLVPTYAAAGRFLASSPIVTRSATFTSTDLTLATTGPETVNVGAVLPPTSLVIGYTCDLADAFDNGAGASLVMEVGHSNDADAYEDGFDCFTGSAFEGIGRAGAIAGPGIGAPAWDGTAVGQCTAAFTCGASTLSVFTNGSVTVTIVAIDFGA